MRKILPLLLIAVALPAIAQEVFSYKDSSGNTVYTNMPPENVEATPVNVPTTQTVSPQAEAPIGSATRPPAKPQQVQRPLISSVTLIGIPDDGAIRSNDGDLVVTVKVESNNNSPANYTYQLLLDGNPYDVPQASNSFTLKDINRGTHSIQANVLFMGSVIASSPTESFTVQRVSTNTPQPWKIKPR